MIPFRMFPALVLAIVIAPSLGAQGMLRPTPSGRATTEVSLSYPRPAAAMGAMPGMAPATAPAKPLTLRIDYGQPHLRGRALHTDSLVPYDKPWRTGANANTTLTTDVDLTLGGAPVTKGTYVLYTIPGRTNWKLILQRSVGQSAMEYADSNNVAHIDLRHTTLAAPLESLTMWLVPSLDAGPAHGVLRFAWGTDELSVDWSTK